MMMATAITPMKTAMSCGFNTRRRMIISGRLKPTTDIMKASTVPRLAPFSMMCANDGDHAGGIRVERNAQQHRRRYRPPGLLTHDGHQGFFWHVAVNTRADGDTDDDVGPHLADDLSYTVPGAAKTVLPRQVFLQAAIPSLQLPDEVLYVSLQFELTDDEAGDDGDEQAGGDVECGNLPAKHAV